MIAALPFVLSLLVATPIHWDPKYAQNYTPEQRKWFQEQKVPNGRITCCSVSDGALVEEDIRENHYWIKCPLDTKCPFKKWTQVPDEALIKGPNKIGRPVVWWGTGDDDEGEDPHPFVKCYVPGAGL
jgi:hypothetical protein